MMVMVNFSFFFSFCEENIEKKICKCEKGEFCHTHTHTHILSLVLFFLFFFFFLNDDYFACFWTLKVESEENRS